MFARFIARLQLRRSTAFLLERSDDHLLADIGLSRAELEASDFAPFRAMAEPYLARHRLGETKVAFESTIVEKGNWKLVWENNRECYHCAGNHPELCRTYPEAPTATGVQGVEEDPEMIALWENCEAIGLKARFQMAKDGRYRITRIPLLNDAVSYTMSGKAAVKKPLSDAVAGDTNIGAMLLFNYPTTWNHLMSDQRRRNHAHHQMAGAQGCRRRR